MDQKEHDVQVALIGATVGIAAVACAQALIRRRLKHVTISEKRFKGMRNMWIAAGRVTERAERGYYDGHTKEDILLDWEVETIKVADWK